MLIHHNVLSDVPALCNSRFCVQKVLGGSTKGEFYMFLNYLFVLRVILLFARLEAIMVPNYEVHFLVCLFISTFVLLLTSEILPEASPFLQDWDPRLQSPS